IAVDDVPLSTNEVTPLTGINVLGNDTDADGDPLTVTSASSTDGTVTINPDGSLDFTPNADFNGPTTIQYTIDDGNGGSDTATVTINVAPVNDAPVAGGSVAGVEDVPLVLSWADFGVSDVDSPPGAMSIEIASLPADGRLEVLVGANWTPVAIGQSISNATIDSGALRFVPAADESGSDVFGGTGTGDQQADYAVFDFVAHDGQGAETAGTLIIDIQPVADQPSLALGPTVVDPTTDHFFLPAGTGLALDRFDNVATLDPASAADADVLESTLAALTPDASSVVMDLGSGNTAATAVDVPLDAAFRLTGLIYLESGHSYTLSGYRDDTFHVEIGGQVLISDGHNTWGSYATAAFTPTETGYYTIEAYVYNGDGVGDVSVLVSTDGGTPQPLSAHATFTDVAAVASAGGQLSEFVGGADGGYYPVRRNEGLEDTPIQLQGISAALADNDGSEALTLSIGSLPDGSVLSDGSNSFVASAGATTADVTGWDVEGLQITAPPGFTGSFTLDVSATSTESSTGQAATTTLPLVVTVLDVDRAPSIAGATVRVSEEGLADGIADAIGVPVDAGDSAVASGAMLLSNPDNDPISVSLSAPAASLTSAGQPVSWSGDGTSTLIGSANGSEVIRVSVAADGSYTVSLAAALDHSGVGIEDVLEFNVGVTISDGTGSSTAPLRVVVEDDAPGVATTTAAVHVAVDEIVVSGLEAGWTNAVFINGTNQVTRINNDADAYNDAVMWGRPASGSGQSGYVLDDDDVLASAGGRQVQAGESFVIAEFSHLNWPVYSNSSLLDSVTLNIDMQVAINGVAYPVSFEVLVDHEETPNNGADPRDIITLPAQSVTVNVGGQDYEIRLDGFVDGNGNVVNVIRTDEQASNEFSIVGSIVSNDPLPTVSGNVFAEAGADGSAVGVAWGNTASSNGVLQTGPDGSYQFIVDRDVRESLEPGQTLTETFGYTITDRDGDSQNGTLVVRISGHQRVDGTSGGDNLVGGGEDELLSGFAGSDQIDGGGGNDVLIGGAGDDDMSGGIGADVFVWELADRGAAGNPAQDTISDFDTAASSDALDLRDLLQGESHGIDGGNLGDYLHFESSGADTIVHVSSNGGFSSGYSSAQEDVSITLQGVDLFSGGLSTDQQVIQDLLSKGKLITD
ncbi:MAG: cadherin-like domain-containing protein, partial [Rhodocyclaceae bacterium]|nr:cadherin-like domain-containing protein [Rhodocyclaceae bacterium]